MEPVRARLTREAIEAVDPLADLYDKPGYLEHEASYKWQIRQRNQESNVAYRMAHIKAAKKPKPAFKKAGR